MITKKFIPNKWTWLVLDLTWLMLLALYVVGGMRLVPFHGDESTIIWMSKDYSYLFSSGELERVQFNDNPIDASEQHLRLLNGPLTKYVIGFVWTTQGYTVEDINEQWHWGFDWNWNLDNGHIPGDDLLHIARWPSTLMLIGSVIAVFVSGLLLSGRLTAYFASFIYGLHPVVLLNGRRAMFEGGLLLLGMLVLLTAIWFVHTRSWRATVVFGLVCGLGVSNKHSVAFAIVATLAAVMILLVWTAIQQRQTNSLDQLLKNFRKLLIAGVIATAVFLVLNPVWWGDPVSRVGQVLEARTNLLDQQVALFGGYADLPDQIAGFFRQVFPARPQYFEVADWSQFISGEISSYEASYWDGYTSLQGRVLAGGFLAFCTIGVLVWLRRCNQCSELMVESRKMFSGTALVLMATTLILTPIEWQRYYLMLIPLVCLSAATGLAFIASAVIEVIWSVNRPPREAISNAVPESHPITSAE